MDQIIPFRDLPDNMKFHAFFSYRNNDEQQSFVRQLISELHTKYGLKCCDHDLDFQPGVDIISNINYNINNSSKTVIVLSKDYLESEWCQYEMKTIITMSVQQHKTIITLVTEKCEIPQSLLIDTYIDATSGDMTSWIKKLVNAIESKDEDAVSTNYRFPSPSAKVYNNLEVIHKETTSPPCSQFAFPAREVPDYFSQCGIGAKEYRFLVNRIGSHRIVNRRHVCNPYWPLSICWYIIVPEFFFAGIFVPPFVYYNGIFQFDLLILAIFGLLVGVPGMMWPCYCWYSNNKGRKEIRMDLLNINKTLMTHSMFVTLEVSRLSGVVVTENPNSCHNKKFESGTKVLFLNKTKSNSKQNHIEQHKCDTDGEIFFLRDQEQENEEVQAVTEEEIFNDPSFQLLCVLFDYFEDYLAGKLVKSSGRHVKNAMCLCEYLEEKTGLTREIIEV